MEPSRKRRRFEQHGNKNAATLDDDDPIEESPPPNPNVNKPRAIYYIYKGKTPKS
jgi:hypothetical protein